MSVGPMEASTQQPNPPAERLPEQPARARHSPELASAPPAQQPSSRPVRPLDMQLADTAARVIASPLASPVHIKDGHDRAFPMASSVQIEDSTPPDSRSRTPQELQAQAQASPSNLAAGYRRPVQRVQVPRVVSNGAAGEMVSPDNWLSRQTQSPTIIEPEQNVTAGFHNLTVTDSPPQGPGREAQASQQVETFQYHHQRRTSNASSSSNSDFIRGTPKKNRMSRLSGAGFLSAPNSRPGSAYSPNSELGLRGRRASPGIPTQSQLRTPSRHSPDVRNSTRPISVADLQALPYAQQHAPKLANLSQAGLQNAVGSNASLLSRKQTLDAYRNNIKKTTDLDIQYGFATFLVETAQMLRANPQDGYGTSGEDNLRSANELLHEAKHILQRLADRSYPFAQYYLGDGLANGILNKGKEDDNGALPLFIAASKHGHAESAYRAALCYEYGWGTAKNPTKAVPYLRQAASKNHPGAMFRLSMACLKGDLGEGIKYREGIKWLKRAAEAADGQYNGAPYELGCLHEVGYGDDVFKDEAYAAQLFTQSAELGHAEANYRLGDAYEHGKLKCPKDNALSIHFYHGAAARGHAAAAMALCAWYMIGAPPVLEKDENEAYEWAHKSAEGGLAKAQYATGYFTEMGIGCRRDPLEANVWYVRAADQGDERAIRRLAAIQAVASGRPDPAYVTKAPKAGRAPAQIPAQGDSPEGLSKANKGKKRFGVF